MYPQLQLISEHTCPKCDEIVHVLYGMFDEKIDKYICLKCEKDHFGIDEDSISEESEDECSEDSEENVAEIKCSSCGGIDHLRSSSRKCPNYKPRKKPKLALETKSKLKDLEQVNTSTNLNNNQVMYR